jgi:hypothetical protein
MQPGRRAAILLLAGLFAAGCRSKDTLETELRTREIQYRELLDEFDRTQHHNEALERENQSLRKGWKILPEQAAQTFTVRRITLGRLTGGQNTDNISGDDALQVVVEPRDGADHAIKAPGTLHVLALEVSAQGIKTPIGAWDVSSADLTRAWKGGLLGSGYVVTLPWKSWPSAENVRVVVRLELADGRVFEADKDIRVRLAPGTHPRPMPPVGPLMPDGDPLHPPRPLDEQSRTAPATGGVASVHLWQGAPLSEAVRLQRPVPLDPDR